MKTFTIILSLVIFAVSLNARAPQPLIPGSESLIQRRREILKDNSLSRNQKMEALRKLEQSGGVPIDQPKHNQEEFEACKTNAAAWRSLTNKPTLPQEAHKYQVLAVDAVQEKRFEDAVTYYEQGLAIYPLWPDAQHDVGIIDSKLDNYGDAAFHMRCYVELVPNAPDAQVAGDQIIIWNEKAKIAEEKSRIGYVSVVGEVRNPSGNISCNEQTTLLRAIQTAGGFTDFANKKRVQIIRAGDHESEEAVARVPLAGLIYKATKKMKGSLTVDCEKAAADPKLDLPVHPGDQIIVAHSMW